LVPFFQTVPSVARQLSTDWARALDRGAASAAAANSIATLFSFFMILLSRKAAGCLRYVQIGSEINDRQPRKGPLAIDD
jgi:hypothetical protein